ncbi:MAG: hypothetical protein ACK5IJ_06560 [Mangrovibacterium sp.]
MKSFPFYIWFFLLLFPFCGSSQSLLQDTLPSATKYNNIFSDSALVRIRSKKFTRIIYEGIAAERGDPNVREKARQNQYANLYRLQGKTIGKIRINRLDAFGPTLEDTAFVHPSSFVKWANKMHAKSSAGTIEKNIFLKSGDELNSEIVLENERLIRQMEYIRDARILAELDSNDTTKVNLVVITKDVFSYGAEMQLKGLEDGFFSIFNQNIWGIGHQLGGGIVWNTQANDGLGIRSSYTARNIKGTYTDATVGFINSYRQKGMVIDVQRPFAKTNTHWAGGTEFYKMWRTNSYYETEIVTSDTIRSPVNYTAYDLWSGYAFKLGNKQISSSPYLVLAARYRNVDFISRPKAGEDGKQYFADSKLYMLSLSLSKRQYIRDNHIYSYGITEDIPKGFLHEFVFGHDDNEFNQRLYGHLFISSGNLIQMKPTYLYLSAGFGSFFNKTGIEQGELQLNFNLISRQFKIGNQIARQFISAKYVHGYNRFNQEYLELDDNDGIRGFESNLTFGKKKFYINTETLYFLNKKFWGFNMAFFNFFDIGVLAHQDESIFKGRWYSGFGAGIRFKNESLVFDTIQLRFAFYPGSPSDQTLFGVQGGYLRREIPYDFQARKPINLEYR